jgi:hypothetical protein
MVVDSQSALRGVRTRLMGAVVAVLVTLVCGLYAIMSAMSSFGATFAMTVGLCSFGAAVALLLSARHEEEVHAFAAQLGSGALPQQAPKPARLMEARDAEEREFNKLIYKELAFNERRALPEPLPIDETRRFSRRYTHSRPTDSRPGLAGVRRRADADTTDGAI